MSPDAPAEPARLVALTAEKAADDHIHEIGTRGRIVAEREGFYEVMLEHARGGSCRALCAYHELVSVRPLAPGLAAHAA
jgi:hypothetical protein